MFLRKKIIKGHEYWYLVKNVYMEGKNKQKVVKYLGKWGTFDPANVIKEIEAGKGEAKQEETEVKNEETQALQDNLG